ncbi:MAG: hypothetical protein Q9217_005739 [Psora testacea]
MFGITLKSMMRSGARTLVEEAPFKFEASKQTIELRTIIRIDRSSPELHLSIALQDRPSTAQKTIFLLPDGSGSAMVYSQFPQISDSACVVAFNSPFLINHDGTSISFKTSIEDLCLVWVEEIRRRQPHGPFILSGYSAGGYYTFEVAKQLRHEGEKVEKLVLFDSPCRVEFGAPQMEAIRFLSDHGMFERLGRSEEDA